MKYKAPRRPAVRYKDRFGITYSLAAPALIGGDCGCEPARSREPSPSQPAQATPAAKPAPKEESKLSGAAAVGLIAGVYGGVALINHYLMKPEPLVEPDARETIAEKLRVKAQEEVVERPKAAIEDADEDETDEDADT